MEEMTFALEEEVFQAPDIPGTSALEEINTLAENKNKESDKAEKRGEKKQKSSEKPAEKKVSLQIILWVPDKFDRFTFSFLLTC
jgi:HIV Tat-specific factor 1